MSIRRRLSDRLIDACRKACNAQNEILSGVLLEAVNLELAGVHHRGYVDRRPNSRDFRRVLTLHCQTFQH